MSNKGRAVSNETQVGSAVTLIPCSPGLSSGFA